MRLLKLEGLKILPCPSLLMKELRSQKLNVPVAVLGKPREIEGYGS